jgi:hypothetical protein
MRFVRVKAKGETHTLCEGDRESVSVEGDRECVRVSEAESVCV